ncbi:MAG: hypothetical protein KKD77_21585, partial [Gammaproteobacteria bacterium]|nr:hypothetical protein [Gammaproteobacteria bacterium]
MLDIDFNNMSGLTDDAAEFMARVVSKTRPNNPELAKRIRAKDQDAVFEFIDEWGGGERIPETMREMGYGITRFGDEHIVLKEVSNKAKVIPYKHPGKSSSVPTNQPKPKVAAGGIKSGEKIDGVTFNQLENMV